MVCEIFNCLLRFNYIFLNNFKKGICLTITCFNLWQQKHLKYLKYSKITYLTNLEQFYYWTNFLDQFLSSLLFWPNFLEHIFWPNFFDQIFLNKCFRTYFFLSLLLFEGQKWPQFEITQNIKTIFFSRKTKQIK